MNKIAAHLGGSKTTLYNYFPSKESLFLEVVQGIATGQKKEIISLFKMPLPTITENSQRLADKVFLELQNPTENIGIVLHRIGEKLLSFICSPEILAIHRLIIGESGRSDIGRIYYEGGPQTGMEVIAAFLGAAMKNGQLRHANPHVAAAHLRGLLEAEW